MTWAKLALVAIALSIVAVSAATAEKKEFVMWAVHTRWIGGLDEKLEHNYVTLEKKATITEITGNARSYCIYSDGEEIVCGGNNESIVGENLGAGTYMVFPQLIKGVPKSKVYVHLKYSFDQKE